LLVDVIIGLISFLQFHFYLWKIIYIYKMAHSSYLEFLLNQPEKKFMKTIDLVYIYKETEEKII
jgi:hypothetical protein